MTQPAEAPIDVVGGTQIPLDAAYILDLILKNAQNAKQLDLTQRGQDIDVRGQDITQRGQDMVYLQAMMQYQQQGKQAAAAYDIDMKNYGAQVARDNFQQRLSEAQLKFQDLTRGIDLGRFDLEKDMANFQQRATVAGLEQSALGMLADRSGPQDWIGYASMLEGLSGPKAAATGSVDPLALLKNVNQPSKADVPAWARKQLDTSGLVQQHTAQAPNASQYMSLFGANQNYQPPPLPANVSTPAPGGLGPVSDYVQTPVQNNFTYNTLGRGTGAEWGSGVPLNLVKEGWNYLPTGSADAIDVSRFDPSVKAYIGDPAKGQPTSLATGTIAAGTPYWLQRTGQTAAAAAPATAQLPVPNDPSGGLVPGATPRAAAGGTYTPLAQQMAQQSMAGLGANGSGTATSTAQPATTLPPGTAQQVRPPQFQTTTGTNSTNAGGMGMQSAFTAQQPRQQGGQQGMANAIQSLFAQFQQPPAAPPALNNWGRLFGGEGGAMPPGIAALMQRMQGGGQQGQPFVDDMYSRWMPEMGEQATGRSRFWQGQGMPRAAAGGKFEIGPVLTGDPVSGQPGGTQEAVSVTTSDPNAQMNVEPVNPMGKNAELVRMLRECLGPEADAIIAMLGLEGAGTPEEEMGMGEMGLPPGMEMPPMPMAAAGGSYGTAATDPSMVFNMYDPKTIGNQPWIQALQGKRPQSLWSGFGASLDNPSLGIKGMPDTLNLATWNMMPESAQLAAQNLYGKGLSTHFGDIMGRSARAAPGVGAVGATGYG
jgi:hypothetical protein